MSTTSNKKATLFSKFTLLKILLCFLLLTLSGMLTYSNKISVASSKLSRLTEIEIPGKVAITSIPDSINLNEPISIYLESQLSSPTARRKRAFFFSAPTSDFSLRLEYEYKKLSGEMSKGTVTLSTDDPLTIFTVENVNMAAAKYIRLPLFSMDELDASSPINLKFIEIGDKSNFFDSELYARNLNSSAFLTIWSPLILFIAGILLAFEFAAGLIINFFQRGLLPDEKSYSAAVFLSLIFGILGFDRIYLGFIAKGIMKALTLGGFGLWYIYDIFMISSGKLKTANGKALSGGDLTYVKLR